jgi:tRNA 2-thiouridine synthesizing protein D
MSVFSLAVYSAPYSSEASYTALRFAQALLSQGHQLLRVFFYQDGVHNSSALTCPPQDEINLTVAWQDLAKEHQIDLVICIAAALRRGILNQEESARYNKAAHNLLEGFQISGLGQLLDAAVNSDRLISFGH